MESEDIERNLKGDGEGVGKFKDLTRRCSRTDIDDASNPFAKRTGKTLSWSNVNMNLVSHDIFYTLQKYFVSTLTFD